MAASTTQLSTCPSSSEQTCSFFSLPDEIFSLSPQDTAALNSGTMSREVAAEIANDLCDEAIDRGLDGGAVAMALRNWAMRTRVCDLSPRPQLARRLMWTAIAGLMQWKGWKTSARQVTVLIQSRLHRHLEQTPGMRYEEIPAVEMFVNAVKIAAGVAVEERHC